MGNDRLQKEGLVVTALDRSLLWAGTCAFIVFTQLTHAEQPGGDEYMFVAHRERYLIAYLKPWYLIGQLDADGDFTFLGKYNEIGADPKHPFPVINAFGPNPKAVYEFRSNRLIKGTMRQDGTFLPDLDSKVTRFEDYKYGPEAAPIWNLPGYFMHKDKLEERRKWLADHAGKDPGLIAEKARLDAAVEGKK
jgi:hypothetical protein